MKKFTNQNVLKETKNNNKIIIIGVIILVFGIALGLWGGYEIDKTSENAKSFSELLLSDEEKEEIKPTGNTLDIIQPVCVAL